MGAEAIGACDLPFNVWKIQFPDSSWATTKQDHAVLLFVTAGIGISQHLSQLDHSLEVRDGG
eukprot:scaffold59258_cov34-Prasinocladus_malaysianus.AAC.1